MEFRYRNFFWIDWKHTFFGKGKDIRFCSWRETFIFAILLKERVSAGVAKLADALDLGSSASRHGGPDVSFSRKSGCRPKRLHSSQMSWFMYYVYILRSLKNGSYYKGSTDDLERRFAEHNSGKEFSTARYVPWELAWYCEKPNRQEAVILEKKLKNITSKKKLEDFIKKHTFVKG